ncbi:MAG: hypothetical protein AAF654_13335 [Myxococcota bacterium]
MSNASWRPKAAAVPLLVLLLTACGTDTLEAQFPRIVIEPVADTGQTALDAPAGLDLGEVPLFGVERATFTVRNRGTAFLNIDNIDAFADGDRFADAFATYRLLRAPSRLAPTEEGELVIEYSPLQDGQIGENVFEVRSDDSESDGRFVVRGEGLFVGTPTLQVCYGGGCYSGVTDCTDGNCTLPPLDFGNVPLDASGSQVVTLRNVPADGTCLAPPMSPECTKVCQLTVDRNPDGANVGFALEAAASAFAIAGSVPLPFTVDTALDGCATTDEQQALIRVEAGSVEETVSDALVFETNDPTARTVRVPLVATIREAPTAVAKLKPCEIANPTEPCSQAGEIRPLDQVFLDGSESSDPDGLALTGYRWEVLATPGDFPVADLDFTDDDTAFPVFTAPVAGSYRFRLTVENEEGVRSSPTAIVDSPECEPGGTPLPASCFSQEVEVEVIPASRLSVELTWDRGEVDLDLHLVHVEAGERICSVASDCFWRGCLRSCATEVDINGNPSCTPTNWFGGEPYDGPNPRLDADDDDGPGPETINISDPQAGTYRIYVHYYGLVNEVEDPMRARVRILLDGIPRGEYRRTLNRNELWRMADLVWNDGGSVTPIAPGAEPGETATLDECPVAGVTFESLR